MNEALLARTLRQYRKVRGPDFHKPATRGNQQQGRIENGGGLEKRHPLSKEERAQAEKDLAEGGAGDRGVDAVTEPLADGGMQGQAGEASDGAPPELVDPANFFKEFDAWVDSKYPGDRGSATKLKVAFRKQHRSTVASLCLEDIEDIAQAMQ